MNINEILEFWLNECIKKDLYFEINPEKSKLLFDYVMNNDKKIKKIEDKINRATTRIKTIINIIKEQPTDNVHTDMYIIEALNSLLYILEEVKENE